MNTENISWEAFYERFTILPIGNQDGVFDNGLLDTPLQYQLLKQYAPGQIWTLMQADFTDLPGGSLYDEDTDEEEVAQLLEDYDDLILVSGYHLVNRIGHLVTAQSCLQYTQVWDKDTLDYLQEKNRLTPTHETQRS